MAKKMSLKEVGDSFFCAEMETLVDKQPYISFVFMASIIEFIGKCYCRCKDGLPFQVSNTRYDYCKIIKELDSLKKYSFFNFKDSKGYNNYMYTELRCGMVHALLPKTKIKLSPTENELGDYTIGASELYSDIKNAWEEIMNIPEILQYVSETPAIEVYDNTSGGTASNGSVSASTIQ